MAGVEGYSFFSILGLLVLSKGLVQAALFKYILWMYTHHPSYIDI